MKTKLYVIVLALSFSYLTVLKKKESLQNEEESLQNEKSIDTKQDIYVTTPAQLYSAINNAQAGETIIMANGEWNNINVIVNNDGTSNNYITLKAETAGGATITGTSQIRVNGSYVQIEGFIFTNGEPVDDKGAVVFYGSYNKLFNTAVYNYNGTLKKWVSLYNNNHEVAYCTFDGKNTEGALFTVWRTDDKANYHHIHHNFFKNYSSGGGDNGYETMRIGTSTYSQSSSYSVIEYNLFINCDGEIETISNKSGHNEYRGNTFIYSIGLLTLRHGKNCLVEDNVFLTKRIKEAGGIRIYDGGHTIRNNYIQDVNTGSNTRGGIVLHSGNNAEGGTTSLSGQWTAENLKIENNTIVSCRQGMLYGGKQTYPARNVSFKNNIICDSTWSDNLIREDKALESSTYDSETYYGSDLGLSGGTPNGVSVTNPKLTLNNEGLWENPSVGGASGLHVLSENEVGVSFNYTD